MKITRTFEIKLGPLDAYARGTDGINPGRMSIDKTFNGELDATSKGEMLSARNSANNSAGYVAIEQVTGALSGRNGSFVLQHFGTMNKGINRLVLEVVPGSATNQLVGLKGKMDIKVEDGKHYYKFEYELP